MSWKPISEFVYPTDTYAEDRTGSFIVDNGERVGEAQAFYIDWDEDEDGNEIGRWDWAWTHHSTCSCCHSCMSKQPIAFMLLPEASPFRS